MKAQALKLAKKTNRGNRFFNGLMKKSRVFYADRQRKKETRYKRIDSLPGDILPLMASCGQAPAYKSLETPCMKHLR
jgi:hypothetical protein